MHVRDRFARMGLEGAKKARPAAFFVPGFADRIKVGNLEDDLAAAAKTDWVVEAVVENLEIKRARANLWPKVDALAKSGWAYDQKSPSLSIYNYAVGLSLHAPLFEGFKKTYECKRAYADAQATLADVEAKEQEIALDVLSHFEMLRAAEKEISLSSESLAYAEEAYNAALEQYKAGCLSVFSLIECSKTLSLARESEAQAHVHWLAAMAKLAYATGSLWEQL